MPTVTGPSDVPDVGGGAAVVETHVSVLFFLDHVVLKVKKPVRFPFLDFTSLAARRRACEEEVRCNRRLAPDVYLGVAETTLGEEVLDYAVVMRRLPAARNLAAMVLDGDPRVGGGLEAVASVLAAFHDRTERSADISSRGEVGAVRATWDAVVGTLVAYAGTAFDAGVLDELDRLAHRFLAGRRALFEERIAEGRICDGHGDVLASDVFLLDDGPRILDAVEFDPTLRHVDAAADVAFLAVDLERLGAADAALRFVRSYEEAAGARFPEPLFHYYCAQRAMVRAMAACLRAEPWSAREGGLGDPAPAPAPTTARDAVGEVSTFIGLAQRHLRAGRVVLGVVSGLPGSGKSTVAAAVGASLRWPVLRSDEVRHELAGATGAGPLVAPYGAGAYGPEQTEETYATLLERARIALEHGQSVILDATFIDPRWRRAAEQLAATTSSDLAVVETRAPLEVAAERATRRRRAGRDVSGADDEVVLAMASEHRPWVVATAVDTVAGDPADPIHRAREVLTSGAGAAARVPGVAEGLGDQ